MITYLNEAPKPEKSVEGFIVNGEKYRLDYNALQNIPVYISKETVTVLSGQLEVEPPHGD